MNIMKMLNMVIHKVTSQNIKSSIATATLVGLPIAIVTIIIIIMGVDVILGSFFDNVSNQVKLLIFVILILVAVYFVVRKVLKD